MRRNVTGLPLVIFMLYFFLVATPKALLGFAIQAEWEHVSAFMKGLWLLYPPVYKKPVENVPHPIPSNVLTRA